MQQFDTVATAFVEIKSKHDNYRALYHQFLESRDAESSHPQRARVPVKEAAE